MSKKTVVIIASTFIGLLVLLLLGLWLMSTLNHKYYTYEEVEQKMIKATEAFYKNHPEILPVNDGKSTLQYSTLVENKLIDPLKDLLKDGDSCSAEIIVIKNENDYTYIPKLSCSDKYSSIEFVSQFIKNHEVVSEGSGLYSDNNGGYYFRGKVDNNYVKLGQIAISKKESKDLIFRIISIDSNGSVRLRSESPLEDGVPFDTRYNETREYNDGYNDYETSTLKDYLIKLENNDKVLPAKIRSKLIKSNICVGSRSLTDESKDGSTECSKLSENLVLFDLLSPYEYIRASLDENCKNLTDRSCQNFNYLSGNGKRSWTLIANQSNNYQVYSFNGYNFQSSTADSDKHLYLVVKLSPYVMFKSGDGTINNPYTLK